ncbi:MAG: helix-hairpin-helix domain-containing protein, partial [Sphaerochaeta sp.]
GTSPDALVREHRLYQADWLLRQYGFGYDELIFGKEGNLSLEKDPKLVWAESHPDYFPLSVKKASKEQLLRVPGIGPTFASRIVNYRKDTPLSTLEDLRLPSAYFNKAKSYLQI